MKLIILFLVVFFTSCSSTKLIKPSKPTSLTPKKGMVKLVIYRAGSGATFSNFDYVVKNKLCALKPWSYCVLDFKPGTYEVRSEDLSIKSFTELEEGQVKVLGTKISYPNNSASHFQTMSLEEWNEESKDFQEYLPQK